MEQKDKNRNIMRYVSLGTQWMVLLLLGVWAGMKLDEKTGWKFPLFTVLLPLLALIYSLWKIIKEFSKPQK
ncbi:MAG TPA: AtpZ/AtpI family protein [Flavipsychrobacter sp.]|nr:AtpZ/AtpI family protein [Flavipsychrobacter sp.]